MDKPIGEQIKAARVERGMSQAVLAEELGMHESQVSRLENGKTNPTIRTLRRVAEVLGYKLIVELKEVSDVL